MPRYFQYSPPRGSLDEPIPWNPEDDGDDPRLMTLYPTERSMDGQIFIVEDDDWSPYIRLIKMRHYENGMVCYFRPVSNFFTRLSPLEILALEA